LIIRVRGEISVAFEEGEGEVEQVSVAFEEIVKVKVEQVSVVFEERVKVKGRAGTGEILEVENETRGGICCFRGEGEGEGRAGTGGIFEVEKEIASGTAPFAWVKRTVMS